MKSNSNLRASTWRSIGIRQWVAIALLAIISTGVSSLVHGSVRVAYPGSTDCIQGCDFISGGWPFAYLVDNPGISPRGSVSLVEGLLGVDIIRPAQFLGTICSWMLAWLLLVFSIKRWVAKRRLLRRRSDRP